jgi:UrcA family protein
VSASVQAEDQFTERRTQVVTIPAEDLESEAGRRAAYARLRTAVKNVCADVDGRRTLEKAVSYRRCVEDTMRSAVTQVRDPLFQDFVARMSGQRKAVIAAAK